MTVNLVKINSHIKEMGAERVIELLEAVVNKKEAGTKPATKTRLKVTAAADPVTNLSKMSSEQVLTLGERKKAADAGYPADYFTLKRYAEQAAKLEAENEDLKSKLADMRRLRDAEYVNGKLKAEFETELAELTNGDTDTIKAAMLAVKMMIKSTRPLSAEEQREAYHRAQLGGWYETAEAMMNPTAEKGAGPDMAAALRAMVEHGAAVAATRNNGPEYVGHQTILDNIQLRELQQQKAQREAAAAANRQPWQIR